MQEHPELPRLWEKHADAILWELGLTPTTHEPCLYSGTIDRKRIVFMCQVDDFALGAPNQRTANILINMLDQKLTMPIKQQGLLDMFNGVNVVQTKLTSRLTATLILTNSAANILIPGSTRPR
jgi:hypothetical protein